MATFMAYNVTQFASMIIS